MSVVHPDMFDDGWTFETDAHGATGDLLMGLRFMREVYQRADPKVTTRVTVPVLWDTKTGTIVSNESSEIIRMFNSAFDGVTGNDLDFWPREMRSRRKHYILPNLTQLPSKTARARERKA